MKIETMKCTACGAPVQFTSDVDHLICGFCGTSLMVQKGEGNTNLKITENHSQLVKENPNITRAELERLQLEQALIAANQQLSDIKAEIRWLEWQKRDRKKNQRLKELRATEAALLQQIAALQTTTNPHSTNLQRLPATSDKQHSTILFMKKVIRAHWLLRLLILAPLAGFIVLLVCVMTICAVASAIAGPQSSLYGLSALITLGLSLLAFLYVLIPTAGIWQRLRGLSKR